jgi:NADH:ubiquinone oxidoreductase subunit 3 (subunit A)
MLGINAGVVGSGGGLSVNSGSTTIGGFGGVIVLLGTLLAMMVAVYIISRLSKPKRVAPYTCGTLASGDEDYGEFTGPGDKRERLRSYNYYIAPLLCDPRLSGAFGFISAMLILIMFGVA